jgi:hypothetical protein
VYSWRRDLAIPFTTVSEAASLLNVVDIVESGCVVVCLVLLKSI